MISTPTVETEVLKTVEDFSGHVEEIQALRQSCGADDEVLLDPVHFLATLSPSRRSRTVLIRRGDTLVAVVYAVEQYIAGIRTGYAVGGDFSGRGLILCHADDRVAVLEGAISRLLAEGIHSLELRTIAEELPPLSLPVFFVKRFDASIGGDRIDLPQDYESFLCGLGKHTRRNVRYYTRKALEAGLRFEVQIPQETFLEARAWMNATTLYPMEPQHLDRDDRLLALYGGGQKFGLFGVDGKAVALTCGFTTGDRFHMLTQWNSGELEKLSLSLVLRGFLIEHLIATGHRQIHFMGGQSLALGRFCQPQPYHLILVERTGGVLERAKRWLADFALRRAEQGTPLPLNLERLSGAFRHEVRIVRRTALFSLYPAEKMAKAGSEASESGMEADIPGGREMLSPDETAQ